MKNCLNIIYNGEIINISSVYDWFEHFNNSTKLLQELNEELSS